MVFSIGPRPAGTTSSLSSGASRAGETRRAQTSGKLSLSEVDHSNPVKEQTQLRANPNEPRTNEARKSAAREKIEVSRIANENAENAGRIEAAKQTIAEVKSLVRQRQSATPEQRDEIDQLITERLQSFQDAEDTRLQERPELAESRTQSGLDVRTDTQRAKNIERPGVESFSDRGLNPVDVDPSDPSTLDDLEEVVRIEEERVRAAAPQIQERISTTFVQASALADQAARSTPEQLAGGLATAIRQSETFNNIDSSAALNRQAIEVLLTPVQPSSSREVESSSGDGEISFEPPPRSAPSSPTEATKLLA